MIKFKNTVVAILTTFMCLTSSMVVKAEDNSADDHSTNINYEVEESYKWEAPADIVFTNNIDTETKGGAVKVLENIIEGNKTLVISIGSGEDFKITSAEGVDRDYQVLKDSEVLSAGSRVLLIPSGVNEGSQDLDFELKGIVSSNQSQKAGTYTGTLNFEAVLTSNYRIEYHMDGGVNNINNPATYEKDAGDVMLASPTKTGYTFEGWYLSEDYSGDTVSIIANGTVGNIDLYAKWSLTPYSISYNLEEGSNDLSNPVGYNLSQLPITLTAPTKAGYTFKGWTGSNGDTPEMELTIPINTTGNLSYTANWELNSYTISYNLNGGTAENLVTSYNATMLPLTLETPTKANYDFAGWYTTADFSDTAIDTISTSNIGNKTLYAKWTGKQYNITYHLDGGENNVNNPATYAFKGGNVTLLEPTKDGYSFEGWYETADFSSEPVTQIDAGTTGNKAFYAKWNLETYTISYVLNGGTNNTLNPNEYVATALPVTLYEPIKAGATFAGWYETSNFSDSPVTQINASTTGNKTFYAKWNLDTYTITYHLDGGTTTNPASYTVDSLPLTLKNPIKDGYTFLGWYETSDFSGSPVTKIGTGSTSNKTFYAKWSVNSYTYNIVYKSSSDKRLGSETATYEYGTTNVINPKEFAGYSTPESQNVAWDSVTKTITFIYTPVTYTISWELDGGDLSGQSTSYNVETADYTLPIPTKEGCAFAGWFTTGDLSGEVVTKLATGSTGNKMFYAKWDSGNLNNITLKYMDGVTADSNIIVSSVDALPTPSRTGYTFNGWHTASEGIGNNFLTKDDFISDSTYKWTYNSSSDEWRSTGNQSLNNSVSVLRTVEFNAKAGEQLSFEWRSDGESGHDYAAWNIWDVDNSKWLSGASTWGTSNSNSTSGLTPTSGLATTRVNQSSSVYTTNTYTFKTDGTYQIYWTYQKDRRTSKGADLAYVRNVNVPGQAVTIISETPVSSLGDNMTLYARWTLINYAITYDLNGGSVETANPSSYTVETARFTLNSPTRTDYVFGGWYETSDFSGSKVTLIPQGSTGDKIFYAKWYDNYTISYVLNDGTLPSDAKTVYSNGSSYTLPTPTKTNYIFAGWYKTEDFSGSRVTSISKGSTGDKTFYAKWYDNYNITYILNDGTLPRDAETFYSSGSSYTLPTPTRTNYVFEGWYETKNFSNSKKTSIPKGSSGNKTFYAHWYDNYNINYVLNDGLLPENAASFHTSSSSYTLPTPTRENYVFEGWYETEDFSGSKIISIPTGSTGDKIFYAKWYDNYTITYILNDGTLPSDAKTVYTNGLNYTLPIPTKEGYAFAGWFTTNDLSGTAVTKLDAGSTGDKTFYAKWDSRNLNNITLKYMDDMTPDSNITVSSVDTLPTPSRTGYTFNGWRTGSESTKNGTLTESDFISDSTYKWTYNSPTGEWESTGNKGKNNSVSVLKTVEFNAKSGEQLSFEWRSYAESSYDYAAWNIWDVTNQRWLSGVSTWGTSYNDSTSGLTPTSGLATTKGKQSSSVYTTNTYTFTADGTYQIYWTYRKDSSGNNGTDLAYVRNVNVPGQTTIILSETPVEELSDGLTLYGKWNLTDYTITYNLNGGIGVDDSTYTIKTETFSLPTPFKTDYGFKGWYETSDFSNNPITQIDVGTTGNKTFYAKWGEPTYELKTGLAFNALIPSTTTSVVFTDEVMPTGATLIDVDADGDNGVVAWLDADGTTFKISSQISGKKIIANEDSSYMFCGFSNYGNKTTTTRNITSITGLENLDTSNVTNMLYMFYFAGFDVTTFSIGDISNWNTSKVTNMSGMFEATGYNATSWSIGDLSGWNTSNVTDMSNMFSSAGEKSTTWSVGDLSGWDTSKVTNMACLFDYVAKSATTFSLDLSDWDTSSVTNMKMMFRGAGLNATSWSIGDISNWDTSSVTNMESMFEYAGKNATTFNLDLSGWDTSSVTNMKFVFSYVGYNANTFNIDLSAWDTSSITNMSYMFLNSGYNTTKWSIGDLSDWDTSKVIDMEFMFNSAGYSATYSLDLSSWNVNKVTSHGAFNYNVTDKITAPTWVN